MRITRIPLPKTFRQGTALVSHRAKYWIPAHGKVKEHGFIDGILCWDHRGITFTDRDGTIQATIPTLEIKKLFATTVSVITGEALDLNQAELSIKRANDDHFQFSIPVNELKWTFTHPKGRVVRFIQWRDFASPDTDATLTA